MIKEEALARIKLIRNPVDLSNVSELCELPGSYLNSVVVLPDGISEGTVLNDSRMYWACQLEDPAGSGQCI